MVGPGGVSKIIEMDMPTMEDTTPVMHDVKITNLNLSVKRRAVAAGVINIATTKITPTALNEITMAKDKSIIKK